MVGSSCYISGTRRVTLVINPVIGHELLKDIIVISTNATYPIIKSFSSGTKYIRLTNPVPYLEEEDPWSYMYVPQILRSD